MVNQVLSVWFDNKLQLKSLRIMGQISTNVNLQKNYVNSSI